MTFVDPKEPTPVAPPEKEREPNTPIEIVIPPKYGNLTTNPDGSITYTSTTNGGNAPKVDVVELKYTNLSGTVVLVRKQFLVTQRGDVPSNIQTGSEGSLGGNNFALLFAALGLAFVSAINLLGFKKKGVK